MRIFVFLILLLSFNIEINAQSLSSFVEAEKDFLKNVPQENRTRLIERLNLYINYFNDKELKELYGLITERKKKGLSEKEFLKSVKIESEGKYLLFSIESVKPADKDDYLDEPKPADDERNKWFVKGCMKFKNNKGNIKYYETSFDVWLTDNEWYVNRHGFRLSEGIGYESCSQKKVFE